MSTKAAIILYSGAERGPTLSLIQTYDGNLAGCGRQLWNELLLSTAQFQSTYDLANYLIERAVQDGVLGRRLAGADCESFCDFTYRITLGRGKSNIQRSAEPCPKTLYCWIEWRDLAGGGLNIPWKVLSARDINTDIRRANKYLKEHECWPLISELDEGQEASDLRQHGARLADQILNLDGLPVVG
jgi:hypothetical protein